MQSSGSHPNLKIVHPFRQACPNEAMASFLGAIRYAVPIRKQSVDLYFYFPQSFFCFVLFLVDCHYFFLLKFFDFVYSLNSSGEMEKTNTVFQTINIECISSEHRQWSKTNHQIWPEKTLNCLFQHKKNYPKTIFHIEFSNFRTLDKFCLKKLFESTVHPLENAFHYSVVLATIYQVHSLIKLLSYRTIPYHIIPYQSC